MSKYIRVLFLLTLIPIYTSAQSDRYILFSLTGDTLMTRTSCCCERIDTLKTYFVVLKNVKGALKQLSVITVEESGKNSIPCADFCLLPKDTLIKYKLFRQAELGIEPKNVKIKSKILKTAKVKDENEQTVYKRQIKHRFKIGWKTFYTEIDSEFVKNIKDEIEEPQIKRIFGNKEMKKYFFEIIVINMRQQEQTDFFNKKGKVLKSITHKRIAN